MPLKYYEIDDTHRLIFRHDLIEQNTVIAGDQKFVFSNEAEAKLLLEAAQFFGSGEYLIPDNEEEARQALADWLENKKEIEAWFWDRANVRSDDQRWKERMVEACWRIYHKYRIGLYHPPAYKKSPVHRVKVEASADGEPKPIVFSPLEPRESATTPVGTREQSALAKNA